MVQNIHRGHFGFWSHPAGKLFGGIVFGGITAGIPAIVADIVALFKAGQKVESSYEQAVANAKLDYPNLANKPDHAHHITPQYLGGPKNGPTAPLNPAYHQRITNAFRNEYGYGQGPVKETKQLDIMYNVYRKYPLPPGYSYP
jgi:hypothetical protein